ncbi:TonB-dependent receptor [Flavilitoribacter nigricans]|uniref:TonB-dependent receptor n=1 Tax=Flavilitoribacter nigricans (strain ATCC 23147 / DSM 23189 / NBRC 102662 / NCIMB 1420 / SS-2) TaxID=1122177 RepID=A0A2D0MXS0_FLAN2|nr:TonB-dependent receptor [Flavilitoribacter nigricans]PHN01035.1 TonB-dependent receptor [Flavilitoribacter nigricans DSM 23189 = NBRC 102662]
MKFPTVFSLFLIYGLLIPAANGQSRISGRVVDKQDRPIVGANVYLADTYDGTSSDTDGNFNFQTAETSNKELIVTYLGFSEFRQEIPLPQDSTYLQIVLQEDAFELASVVITAGTFDAGEEGKREVLKPLDIVTTAGATADIAGVLNTLPGTTTVGESGRLFVRGGEGYETKTFIDGLQVMNFYSPAAPNTPSRSRFLPFMFSGTSFSTGGYSAEYGQALSSALILQSKFLAPQERTDISLMSVGIDAATTQVWEEASLSAKGQYTNLDPYLGLIDQQLDWIDAPTSWEGSVAYRKKISSSGILKLFGNFNRSAFSLNRTDLLDPELKTQTSITNNYGYLNAMVQEVIGNDWTLKGGFSYTQNRENIGLNTARVKEREQGLHSKLVFSRQLSGNAAVKFGTEYFNRSFLQDYRQPDQFSNRYQFTEQLGALFAESDIYLSDKLLARVGLRSEYVALSRDLHLAPRLSLAYKTTENSQFSAAFGHFRQTVQNEWLMRSPDLAQEQAEHYILNYQITAGKRTFRIEAYHKRYRDLIKYTTGADQLPQQLSNGGSGYARGVDLFWRDNRTFRNVDYWVSYSYLDTERDYRNYPSAATPHFAARHNFSVVYKHFITGLKSQIGLTYTYGSGRPYHDPNRPGFMEERTPAYRDLSANLSYLFRDNIILHLSASNVLGREQIFGYEYAARPDENGSYPGRAIRPPAPRFLFAGIFITFSPDAVLNQLPNL